MSPDLNAMALFVKVVEHKSFSVASRRLGVPISTVSRKVSELEKTLGVRLLERSTRQLRLTELGQEYYTYCRRGLEEIETGTLMLGERQAEISGTLRLTVPPGLADQLIVPLARPLIRYRHVLVSSPDYLNTCGAPVHPHDLVLHRMVTFDGWFDKVLLKLVKDGKTCKVKVEGILALNDYAGILNAVEAGQGIAEIPSIICGEALHDGKLVEVMQDWRFAPTTLSAVYPCNRNLSRIVRLFKDFCIEKVDALLPYAGI